MEYQVNQVKKFIYNDEVQEQLSMILRHVKDSNIFEILGIENQEIKHSNVLLWLLGNNSHGLGNSFFIEFLKATLKSTKANKDYYENLKVDVEKLKEYIYVSKSEEYEVKREFQNIDIIVFDRINKFIFVIENKINAKESKTQLSEYRRQVELPEHQGYAKYFIYLTKHLIEPMIEIDEGIQNREKYLLCSYQDVYEIIDSFLISNKNSVFELKEETKFIIENYKDLLKRRNIVSNDVLKEICEKIWNKREYREALNILYENRPNFLSEILDRKIDSDFNSFIRLDKAGRVRRAIMTTNLKSNDFIQRINNSIDRNKANGIWKDNALVFRIFIEEDVIKWYLMFDSNNIQDKNLVKEFREKIKNVEEIKSKNVTILTEKAVLYQSSGEDDDLNVIESGIDDGLEKIKQLAKQIEYALK